MAFSATFMQTSLGGPYLLSALSPLMHFTFASLVRRPGYWTNTIFFAARTAGSLFWITLGCSMALPRELSHIEQATLSPEVHCPQGDFDERKHGVSYQISWSRRCCSEKLEVITKVVGSRRCKSRWWPLGYILTLRAGDGCHARCCYGSSQIPDVCSAIVTHM